MVTGENNDYGKSAQGSENQNYDSNASGRSQEDDLSAGIFGKRESGEEIETSGSLSEAEATYSDTTIQGSDRGANNQAQDEFIDAQPNQLTASENGFDSENLDDEDEFATGATGFDNRGAMHGNEADTDANDPNQTDGQGTKSGFDPTDQSGMSPNRHM